MTFDGTKSAESVYAVAVADARYLLRRAFRLIDEEARKLGVDALEHQLLVQLRGAPELVCSVSDLAFRLDVQLGFISRLAKELEKRQLVCRERSAKDGRVTLVRATVKGERLARRIADNIRPRFEELRQELSPERRIQALKIWAQNFGVEVIIPDMASAMPTHRKS
jgi:DNA-binding MarR family transcriptional regulator